MKQAGKAAGAGRVLNPVAMAILWLAGAAGGFAAEPAADTHAGGGEAPFLNAWLLLGPCPGGEDPGLETDFIDEANAMPRAGLTMAGKSGMTACTAVTTTITRISTATIGS